MLFWKSTDVGKLDFLGMPFGPRQAGDLGVTWKTIYFDHLREKSGVNRRLFFFP